ncbi:hypothetical protein F5I97DRAFT_1429853 [Phlebopus sp. FC_14]|nr:hypothetical protein F5I97DRAFT_1429853 [Phlebopus sp. FC_14]
MTLQIITLGAAPYALFANAVYERATSSTVVLILARRSLLPVLHLVTQVCPPSMATCASFCGSRVALKHALPHARLPQSSCDVQTCLIVQSSGGHVRALQYTAQNLGFNFGPLMVKFKRESLERLSKWLWVEPRSALEHVHLHPLRMHRSRNYGREPD